MSEEDQHKQPQTAPQSVKLKRQNGKKIIVWLLIIILLASNAVFIALWFRADRDNDKYKKEHNELQQQINDLKAKLTEAKKSDNAKDSKVAEVIPCKEVASESLKENIKAALDSKNTAAFQTYTTNPVHYVLAASEYFGDFSPAEAASALEYTHSATGPWDFNLPAPTIASYDAGFYTDYFGPNTYVGRAASGMVVAFDFDCNNKIKSIFVAADEDLLL